jgi:YggT family protein
MDAGFISLLRLLVDLYATVLIVRLLLQLVQADFFNPLSQTIFKLTAPIVEPLRRILPTIGTFNTATLAAAILMKWGYYVALTGLGNVYLSQLPMFLVISALSLLSTLINIYFYGILIVAISSWIGTTNHPTVNLVNQIIDPFIRPFRRIIPPIGMIDISPMVAIFTLMYIRNQVLPLLNNLF